MKVYQIKLYNFNKLCHKLCHDFEIGKISFKFNAEWSWTGFWNPDQTIWFDQKNREPLSFAIFLASRTALWEKSRDPCKPWLNCAILRIVTSFWGLDGFFLLQLFRWILGTSVWSYDHISLQEKSLLARTICPCKNSNIIAKGY